MEEDLQNLSGFHAAAVVMIAIGIGLIAAMLFLALPSDQQLAVKQSLIVFDAHESFGKQVESLRFVFEIQQKYNEEFYLASTQVLSFPDEASRVSVALIKSFESFAFFSDVFVANQNQTRMAQSTQTNLSGQILGAFIERSLNAVSQ